MLKLLFYFLFCHGVSSGILFVFNFDETLQLGMALYIQSQQLIAFSHFLQAIS